MENNTPINSIPNIPEVQLQPVKFGFKEKLVNFFTKLRPRNKVAGGVMGILFLTGSLGIGAYLVQSVQRTQTQAAGMKLSLSTNTPNVRVGDTFTVVVAIDTMGAKIAAADLGVRYDPKILEAKSIVPVGDFLPVVLIPQALRLSFGRADISLGALVNSSGVTAKSGVGILAEVTFTAKAAGTSELLFGAGSRISAIGQTGEALGEKKTLKITVGGSGSTAPPSSTPAATATPGASATPGATATPKVTSTPTIPTSTPSGVIPTITSVGVLTNYNPWHLDIRGTKYDSTQKARLFDSNGSQWGSDIGLYIINANLSSIMLPANRPPSNCNVGKTCTISIQIVTASGALSNKLNFTLPAN